ncbi:MAG: M48 family metallopeptidase [Chloroflexi bacterium]|nr:M48 family metallopeptidase [Chloroflexota bacterium]
MTSLGVSTVTLGDKTISYELKRSRGRSVRFVVKPESGLTVFVPRWVQTGELPGLLQKHSRWILGRLASCPAPNSLKSSLKSGDEVAYLGRALPLSVRCNGGDVTSLTLERDRIVVDLGAGLKDGSLPAALLERWYRAEADRLIRAKVQEISGRLQSSYNRIFIRGQRTRWGSCSLKRNLGFNWKLIMVPEHVLEYVVIHELAHLEEMNHGAAFWGIVSQWCPGWRDCRTWLRKHGNLANFAIGCHPEPVT